MFRSNKAVIALSAVVLGVLGLALWAYYSVTAQLAKGDPRQFEWWFGKSDNGLADARAQLGQFGDFINPFLTFMTLACVLATFHLQMREARHQKVARTVERYEDALGSIQFFEPDAGHDIWTGRAAFFRILQTVEPEFDSITRLTDRPLRNGEQPKLVQSRLWNNLPEYIDRHAHSFQHAYVAMLELIELDEDRASEALSDVELIYYLAFIGHRRMDSNLSLRETKASELISTSLDNRKYREFRLRLLQTHKEARDEAIR